MYAFGMTLYELISTKRHVIDLMIESPSSGIDYSTPGTYGLNSVKPDLFAFMNACHQVGWQPPPPDGIGGDLLKDRLWGIIRECLDSIPQNRSRISEVCLQLIELRSSMPSSSH